MARAPVRYEPHIAWHDDPDNDKTQSAVADVAFCATQLSAELGQLGMWKHLSAGVATKEAQEVAAGRYPFLLPEEDMDVRYFFVDGEEMAEGGVGSVEEDGASAVSSWRRVGGGSGGSA